jgi:hypothetical protein
LDNAVQQHKLAGSAHRHFRHAIVVPAKRAGNLRMENVLSPCRAAGAYSAKNVIEVGTIKAYEACLFHGFALL